jgi:hypothetical protein
VIFSDATCAAFVVDVVVVVVVAVVSRSPRPRVCEAAVIIQSVFGRQLPTSADVTAKNHFFPAKHF